MVKLVKSVKLVKLMGKLEKLGKNSSSAQKAGSACLLPLAQRKGGLQPARNPQKVRVTLKLTLAVWCIQVLKIKVCNPQVVGNIPCEFGLQRRW